MTRKLRRPAERPLLPIRTRASRLIASVVCGAVLVALGLGVFVACSNATHGHRPGMECVHNVRQFATLLEMPAPRALRGVRSLLKLTRDGPWGPDRLRYLFCPGDTIESFESAGGASAYAELSSGRTLGPLTSYAVADDRLRETPRPPGPVVLLADDSTDHHEKGIVVGYSGGEVRFREFIDDYGLEDGERLVVGPGSPVHELRCLRQD